MARELRIYERPSSLERPVLIGAFRGWNDGGQAATLAVGYLARLWGARKFADIDPELFVDFQATRPMVSLEDGRTRKIEWPENSFFSGRIPGADRDAILLVGVEPNYRWRTFSEIVTELAHDLGVELAVSASVATACETCSTYSSDASSSSVTSIVVESTPASRSQSAFAAGGLGASCT